MKGIIFNILSDMVEEKFGLETLNELIDKSNLQSQGAYTAVGSYSDEELFSLVTNLSEMKNIPINDLISAYGEYLFPAFVKRFPHFFEDNVDLKAFLLSIEDVIHVEVKKLYEDALVPVFRYEEASDNQVVMLYSSPRKLCPLVIGLVNGAATHFSAQVEIRHSTCMHDGNDHCRFEIDIC